MGFKREYGVRYSSFREEFQRRAIFRQNLVTIKKYMDDYEKGLIMYKVGVTRFSDLTPEEFLSRFRNPLLTKAARNINIRKKFSIFKTESTQLSTSANFTNDLSPIRDQVLCGSCWAFSALAPIEAHNNLINLSEQQIVDCDSLCLGCGGGLMAFAYEYIAEKQGVALESNYPYAGKDQTCYDAKVSLFNVPLNKTHPYIDVAPDDISLKAAIQKNKIVTGAVEVTPEWQHYKGGILSLTNTSGTAPDHAINFCGYGTENGVPYWIVRNSWGTTWGEYGYIRLDARKDVNGNSLGKIDFTFSSFPNYR